MRMGTGTATARERQRAADGSRARCVQHAAYGMPSRHRVSCGLCMLEDARVPCRSLSLSPPTLSSSNRWRRELNLHRGNGNGCSHAARRYTHTRVHVSRRPEPHVWARCTTLTRHACYHMCDVAISASPGTPEHHLARGESRCRRSPRRRERRQARRRIRHPRTASSWRRETARLGVASGRRQPAVL